MASGQYNLIVEPGTTLYFPMIYTAGGVPVNLTGYTITAVFQSAPNQDPSLVLSTLNGGVLATPLTGKFTLYGTPAQTMQLAPISNTGVWYLQIASGAATPFVTPLLRGKIIMEL